MAEGAGEVEDAVLAMEVGCNQSDEARKPLHKPLLQVLVAHCESLLQAALNFPHDLMSHAVDAKHSAPPAHCSVFAHSAPRGREPAAATTVDEGAGWMPSAEDVEGATTLDVAVDDGKYWREVGINHSD